VAADRSRWIRICRSLKQPDRVSAEFPVTQWYVAEPARQPDRGGVGGVADLNRVVPELVEKL
jgi:hypothetical protein